MKELAIIKGVLVKGQWEMPDGRVVDTYKIVYDLGNEITVDVPVKGDKAKIILLSLQNAEK